MKTAILQLDKIELDGQMPPNESLMEQFEGLIVNSLFKAFGLNAGLFKDQDGGNVDTIVTARKYGLKDEEHKQNYANRGEYDSGAYHSAEGYKNKNAEIKQQREAGNLTDTYTGKKINKSHLDHTISAKEIHDDPARILAGLDGVSLANVDSNLNATNPSINLNKKASSMDDYLVRLQKNKQQNEEKLSALKAIPNPTNEEKKKIQKYENLLAADAEKMQAADKKARKEYNQTLAKAYYTNKKILTSACKDAAKTGVKMGVREVLGMIVAEVWITIRKNIKPIFQKMKANFQLKQFFLELANLCKTAFTNVVKKYKQFIETFKNGLLSGILSSLTTTIVNMFTGTAKRIVQVIRECWASIIEIAKILFFDKKQSSFEAKMKAVAKVLVGLATVLIGTAIHEAIKNIPGIGQIPLLGDALALFLSALLSGLISIGLLYFIDHSKDIFEFLTFSRQFKNKLANTTAYYEEVNEALTKKVSELAQIPYNELQQLITRTSANNTLIANAKSPIELNTVLKKIIAQQNIDLGYSNTEELRAKVLNTKSKFIFE